MVTLSQKVRKLIKNLCVRDMYVLEDQGVQRGGCTKRAAEEGTSDFRNN